MVSLAGMKEKQAENAELVQQVKNQYQYKQQPDHGGCCNQQFRCRNNFAGKVNGSGTNFFRCKF
jgi:hypothetical protein